MDDKIIRVYLKDELDLHPFHPQDAKAVLREFIEIATAKGIKRVRIAHGKGKSVIKSIIINELKVNRDVISFYDEPGNWGATIAHLREYKNSSLKKKNYNEEQ